MKQLKVWKIVLILLVLQSHSGIYGQVKTIKIKKSITQDKMISLVTIGGLYYGEITTKQLIADKKLRVSNNKEDWRIISFSLMFGAKGNIKSFTQSGDSLTQQIMEELVSRDPKVHNKIYISPIRAVNSNKDTVILNPIELKLVSD